MNHKEYKNRSELEVRACGECHIICSNEVTSHKLVIRVEKEQDKQCVFEGDHLCYTIKICNDSNIDIKDSIFQDDIPDGLEYVSNTFCVNGRPEKPIKDPHSNRLSFKLEELKAYCETTIAFKTVVK